MKKLSALIIAFFLLLPCLFLSACGKAPSGAPSTSVPSPDPGVISETATDEPSVPSPAPVHIADHSYDPATDFDKRLIWVGSLGDSVIETEDAWYWLSTAGGYLRYYDKALGESGVLCGKPECEHDSSGRAGNPDCNGYLDTSKQYMWLNEGRLYYLHEGIDKAYPDSLFRIYSIGPDGTDRRLEKVVPKYDSPYGLGVMHTQYMCYHRGVLYGFCFGGAISGGEPSQPFTVSAFPLDGDEFTTIYDSGAGVHYGSICPAGEYCYIVDFSETNKLLRYSAVTGETELLYEGNELNVAQYWIDGLGGVYAGGDFVRGKGCSSVWRLDAEGRSEVLRFEDPDIDYSLLNVSDGIAIARNYFENLGKGMDPDIDIWIKRYDGTDIFKGKLPMAWLDSLQDAGRLEGIRLCCGDERSLMMIFELNNTRSDGVGISETYALVRYEFIGGKMEEQLLCVSSVRSSSRQ
ncbi:MAG: hypothetical protein J5544_02835 [Clostridia bacterium]|nr:hypothetical protein [Clostridia bacterium]